MLWALSVKEFRWLCCSCIYSYLFTQCRTDESIKSHKSVLFLLNHEEHEVKENENIICFLFLRALRALRGKKLCFLRSRQNFSFGGLKYPCFKPGNSFLIMESSSVIPTGALIEVTPDIIFQYLKGSKFRFLHCIKSTG